MLRSLLLILCLAVMLSAAAAQTQVPAVAQSVIEDLQAQGYGEIEITRTFLGRLRIVAEGPLGEREIVLNPRSGVILRDTFYREDDDDDEDGGGQRAGSGTAGGSTPSGQDDDDDEGDDDEDEDDDDDDDDDDDSDDDGGDDD
ncbi:MAG: hypothetical protein AAFQ39_04470, partial [Pseudomonadota bacterium]